MIDTKLHCTDPNKGLFWGYATPFNQRGVAYDHYYFTAETIFDPQPLLVKGDDEIFPVLWEHKRDAANRLGVVLDWYQDEHGLIVTVHLLPTMPLDAPARALLKAGTCYLCLGHEGIELDSDGGVIAANIREVSLGRWPGSRPLNYATDADYVAAYGQATGFYPPQYNAAKLAAPIHWKVAPHVSE